jgi:glucan endo-1,3-alpha-glucosidase
MSPKYVFAHFMVGNTYPYTASNFETDILDAIATSVDGFALNIGEDDWTAARVETIFSVAESLPFTLFLSFDMSIISSAETIRSYVRRYARHPKSFRYRGQYVVSTFAGEGQTFGHKDVATGWEQEVIVPLAKDDIPISFIPSWTGIDAWQIYRQFPFLDGHFSWAAW